MLEPAPFLVEEGAQFALFDPDDAAVLDRLQGPVFDAAAEGRHGTTGQVCRLGEGEQAERA